MKKDKNKKQVNIYEIAGKAGKGVKKYGGYVISIIGIIGVSKAPNIVKNLKK